MNRREYLAIASSSALGGALLTRQSTARPAKHITTSTMELRTDKVLTHVRMRAHPDGRRCYTWYQGTVYGQLSGQRTVPLLHIEGASTSTVAPQNDAAWLYRLREAGWFCDLASGKVLDEWRNPLNDKLVKPEHYNSKQLLRFGVDGVVTPAAAVLPPGLEWLGSLSEPVIAGNDVWSTEELLVRLPPRSPDATPSLQTSLATLHSDRRDLLRPIDAWVPALLAYQTLASWQAWLEMGSLPGVISWRLAGRKCATLDEIPRELRARVERQHPEVFS